VELLVDPVLLLRKHGGLEVRNQVFSGCSTLQGKQLRVSYQSLEWQSNQATKSQTHEEGFDEGGIILVTVWLLRLSPFDEQALCHVTKPD